MIQNAIYKILFAMQTGTTLEFENYWDANICDAEFVEADELEKLEENNEDKDEEEDSCIYLRYIQKYLIVFVYKYHFFYRDWFHLYIFNKDVTFLKRCCTNVPFFALFQNSTAFCLVILIAII